MTDVASSLFAKFDILHAYNLWWTESAQTFAELPEFRRRQLELAEAQLHQPRPGKPRCHGATKVAVSSTDGRVRCVLRKSVYDSSRMNAWGGPTETGVA